MKKELFWAFVAAISVAATPAWPLDGEILRKEEGWWWYKDPKEKKAPPPPPPPKPVQPAPAEAPPKQEKPALFSVDWLSANLETLRKKAIDDPTDDNVSNYLYAQRVMMDKADNFQRKASQVVQKDPLLDERNRYPVSSFALNYLQGTEYEAKRQALQILAQKGGLWFFFDTSCRFCVIQKTAVDNIQKELNFTTLNVSMDGKALEGMKSFVKDQGQYEGFNLTLLPALVYAVPPDKFMVISQGAIAMDDIKTRLLAYGKEAGLIPENLKREIFVMDRGLLSTDDMKIEGKDVDADDPGTWVKYLRKQLEGRY